MLIQADKLKEIIDSNPNQLIIFDCRHDLVNTNWGYQEYLKGHIPRAIFANLDTDLSGKKTGNNGRHPLPQMNDWLSTLNSWGLNKDSLVIMYDQNESTFSARLWWMLNKSGFKNLQLLDGGFKAWCSLDLPIELAAHSAKSSKLLSLEDIPNNFNDLKLMTSVKENLASKDYLVLDARAPERFKGEVEPLDPVAGHIPNASNRPYKENLNSDGTFKRPTELMNDFSKLGISNNKVIHQCGSGVTACNNLFAMELAGIRNSKLYAGSWSEWCSNPENPMSQG
ncbi:MAG: sulfurtransferase [Betaproteobacteria bacterium]|jgi:thiosulfate/3-mercaptopyruvate sulfurtransferase